MRKDQMVDHLFRHEYGKMVSSMTRMFGVQNLELIEDAVQDTFQKAVVYFRNHKLPDNPQGWLRTVARNRAIDLFRKANLKDKLKGLSGPIAISMAEVFSDHEIEDSQLRLLFTICHPSLNLKDQIIFALKTLSGFSHHEISRALLLSDENVKKSLFRARKNIEANDIKFDVPDGQDLLERIEHVHLVIYLLFNEGFHSSGKESLIRKDLVAEAMRLNDLLIERWNNSNSKALMAMMCFHGARLESKISVEQDLIKLRYQDRKLWNYHLIFRGNEIMQEVSDDLEYSRFHWEAAIAGEYANAPSFDRTNWKNLEIFHKNLIEIYPSPVNILNLCVIINLQNRTEEALTLVLSIDNSELKGKEHLYYSVLAEIYNSKSDTKLALQSLNLALENVVNPSERKLILDKIASLTN